MCSTSNGRLKQFRGRGSIRRRGGRGPRQEGNADSWPECGEQGCSPPARAVKFGFDQTLQLLFPRRG